MKPNFILVCDSATLSEPNKKLDIKGVFDFVFSKEFPAIHPALCIIANIEIPTEQQNKFYIETFKISFEGKEIGSDSTNFEPKTSRHQFIHNIQGIPLEKEGRYDVEIEIGGNTIAKTYFVAKKI